VANSKASKPGITKRIGGRQRMRIRARVLSDDPMCAKCRTIPAAEVDHIIALENGGDEDLYDDTNRQGLCAACHLLKTADDLGWTRRGGCDAQGNPLDPESHWCK
jgi:5-methylcytosine-specific restriction protein A